MDVSFRDSDREKRKVLGENSLDKGEGGTKVG